MEMVEEQMPAPHPPQGEGKPLRLFDGTTHTFKARGEDYTLVEVSAPPGCGPPPHVHRDQDEEIWVVEGEFSFFGEDGSRRLCAGGVESFPMGTVHAFKVVGSVPGRCLMVMTPPGGAERFAEEVGVPVSGGLDGASLARPEGLPETEEVLACARRNGIEFVITPV